MKEPIKVASNIHLAWEAEYHSLLGHFHGMWATIDVTVDYAITKFLNVTHEQGHLITSGMMFGRKARLLADLIRRSDHPKKAELKRALGKVQAIRRDLIAHGYQSYNKTRISFLERAISGEFKAKRHTFTHAEFADFVGETVLSGNALYAALAPEPGDLDAFAEAALSLDLKSKTSPGSPLSSK